MMTKKMVDALNDQINAETYSAYLYMSMSAYCTFIGLKGAANWFFVQTQEEMTHAMRFYFYVNKVNQHVVLKAIEKPPAEFKSLNEMYEAALKHEKYITGRINNLVNLAQAEKDHATEVLLQWFVNEQVEEEQNVTEILGQLKLAGKDSSALFMIDKDLSTRTFVMPPDLPMGQAAAGA